MINLCTYTYETVLHELIILLAMDRFKWPTYIIRAMNSGEMMCRSGSVAGFFGKMLAHEKPHIDLNRCLS